MRLKNIVPVLFLLIALNAKAQVKDSLRLSVHNGVDSAGRTHKLVPFILPVALITYGVLSFEVKSIRHVDFYLDNQIANSAPNFHTNAETYFLFTPIVLVYGLNLAGVAGKNNFADRTGIIALSAVYAGVFVYPTKYATRHSRENPSLQRAFPSGHTAAAFAGAEFLTQEYGDQSIAYPIIGYSFAIATGVFRLYNHDHWFSEVVAGAGVGILSTKLAYLTYPYIRKCFTHSDKKGKSAMLMPTYQNGAPGLSFAMQL